MIKKSVYICYPFRANEHATQEENIKAAQRIAEKIREGGIYEPIVTHGMFPHLNDNDNRKLIMDLCKGILNICDEVWVCSRVVTSGMFEELEFAEKFKIKTEPMYDEFKDIKIETGGNNEG